MENTPRTRVKSHFYFSSALPKRVSFFIKMTPLCDTCDSKKSTSLLEGARVHAFENQKTRWGLFCHLHYTKQGCRKIFCHFFLDFSLFGAISTHILIGTGWTYVAHMWYGRNKENNERTMKRGSEGVAKIREKVRERKRACVWARAKKLHLNNQTQLKTKNKGSESLSCWLMEIEVGQNSVWRLIWCNPQHWHAMQGAPK